MKKLWPLCSVETGRKPLKMQPRKMRYWSCFKSECSFSKALFFKLAIYYQLVYIQAWSFSSLPLFSWGLNFASRTRMCFLSLSLLPPLLYTARLVFLWKPFTYSSLLGKITFIVKVFPVKSSKLLTTSNRQFEIIFCNYFKLDRFSERACFLYYTM